MVLVVGMGRSGAGSANLLASKGMEVAVTDLRSEAELAPYMARLDPKVKLLLGGHPERAFLDAELIVLSPGVPLNIGPLVRAREAGVRVIGELELAYQELKPLPFYAITGTNGKSTTTTLVDLIMRRAGRRPLLGGNIGNALTEEVVKGAGDVDCVVAEVSSFQLETIEEFRPAVGAVLNVTPDHLDRYRSMEEYRRAKARISMNQRTGDTLVLNADDPETMRMHEEMEKGLHAPCVVLFSRRREVRGVFLTGGDIAYDMGAQGVIMRADQVRIKGVHNLENAMAASAVALAAGAPPEAVRQALAEFAGLEHRLEFVRELGGVRYINDSKGTNVGAVVKSLESFTGPVVLIAGGRDKKGDFPALRPFVKGRVKAVVLMGEASEKIKLAIGDLAECVPAVDMPDAVRKARGLARSGDVVLLSPACASFDMFRDFEDRGRAFKRAVTEL
jgi:UDP-N-acetylmuramoylalanine--D-glutamate ligase